MNEEQNNRGHELPKKIKIVTDIEKGSERMLDAVIANPPLPEFEPRTTPISPGVPPILPGGADGTEPGDDKSHIGRPEAAYMLAKLARLKDFDADYVTALQMGARALMKRHFECQRNKAKRRAAAERKEAQA